MFNLQSGIDLQEEENSSLRIGQEFKGAQGNITDLLSSAS